MEAFTAFYQRKESGALRVDDESEKEVERREVGFTTFPIPVPSPAKWVRVTEIPRERRRSRRESPEENEKDKSSVGPSNVLFGRCGSFRVIPLASRTERGSKTPTAPTSGKCGRNSESEMNSDGVEAPLNGSAVSFRRRGRRPVHMKKSWKNPFLRNKRCGCAS